MTTVRNYFLQSPNLLTLVTYFSIMILLAYYVCLLLSFISYNHRPHFQFLAALSSSSSRKKKLLLQNDHHGKEKKKKIIVILGATGSGKSRLSIDLATRLHSSNFEIINSDKIQLYKGLPITTNKMPMHERLGVPHHLIDAFDSFVHTELKPIDFRSLAASTVEQILSRNNIPILVGGSNSFVYSFLTKEFDSSVMLELDYDSISSELRYKCCFLWIYVALPVLKKYVFKRVDQMLEAGLLKELAEFYESIGGKLDSVPQACIKKSIGVPEFEHFFQLNSKDEEANVAKKEKLLEEAVQAMKDNTYELAKKQIERIEQLRTAGWNIQKLDATEVIRMAMDSESDKSSEIWEKEVMKPSINSVKQFLFEDY